ncbi:hypothetical protein PRIPAC_93605 [Pristionchus pacificus]|uniref:Uncharacterized protein n=1 Tax=Pristionchus pacificus TaxID=54126 RepID=A0A2A6CE88_PRIPA|nr:hypothetical protein PRIPAC_93605 [Pristionchus pacificus]|eukprot:PDM76426.1 hypothetical protein PRIPAC_40030 [Pristionchus pacificus]
MESLNAASMEEGKFETWTCVVFLIAATLVIFSGVAYVIITRETPEERLERFFKKYDPKYGTRQIWSAAS